MADAAPDRMRADKWLWQARFFKTRALAAAMIARGRLRRNGQRMVKPGGLLRPGDVVTFPQGAGVRVVRVTGLGHRRGPAAEAATLYTALDVDTAAKPGDSAMRAGGD